MARICVYVQAMSTKVNYSERLTCYLLVLGSIVSLLVITKQCGIQIFCIPSLIFSGPKVFNCLRASTHFPCVDIRTTN